MGRPARVADGTPTMVNALFACLTACCSLHGRCRSLRGYARRNGRLQVVRRSSNINLIADHMSLLPIHSIVTAKTSLMRQLSSWIGARVVRPKAMGRITWRHWINQKKDVPLRISSRESSQFFLKSYRNSAS